MVHVETIDLASRGVTLPSDRVGMVIAQPHLSLTVAEPYQCTTQSKQLQLAVLTDTLTVARAVRHGAPKTHFTIFPEYSIPGLEGIALIEAALRTVDWPTGTIVIGGTDALSKQDFVTLAGTSGTHVNASDNALNRITQNEWINCCIIWVKSSSGVVERWLQPKLFPSGLEQNVSYQNMFRGNSVFIFSGPLENGTQYRFCSLVCFDWIATLHNQKAWRWILDALHQQATRAQAELSLSWFFVIQNNPKPSHDTFLTEVRSFFDQTIFPNVRRDRACLVFANTAGKDVPGKIDQFGSTSLILSHQTLFSKPDCHPTFSNGGQRFHLSTLLSSYQDVYFREGGACIHSFLQVNPGSLNPGAAGRIFPVENAFVFPVNGNGDPRTPAAIVPACIKWLNDELDHIPRLSAIHTTAPLVAQSDAVHQQTVAALRVLPAESVTQKVKLAAQQSQADHADQWDSTECEAMEHVVHTLDIVGIGFTPTVAGADPAHATVVVDNQMVDLLAIRGNTHEACIEHSKGFLPLPRRQVLLISRDRDNTYWRRKFGSILQPNNPQLGAERNFTDPNGGSLYLGYQNLLDIFRKSATAVAVQGAINAELAA
jgi:hypothetical protein